MKPVEIEYGEGSFTVMVPDRCEILGMPRVPPLPDPRSAIEDSLSSPVGTPPLEALVGVVLKRRPHATVAVAVSDNTRPTPYSGERSDGILPPLLNRLQKSGIERKNIRIIVATGTHAPPPRAWARRFLGADVVDRYSVVDHDCVSPDLRPLGTVHGVPVRINRRFIEADIRIVTGLVEPHFMAGFSGGRKLVCPGLVDLETTRRFHGADYMDHPRAANLTLEGNPCHGFALEAAKTAGVHFCVNAVLDADMRLRGVFSGELEEAHRTAVAMAARFATVEADREYDIVLTHGGRVAVNHYQAAKAAYATIPIVKRGGTVILAAHNGDEEPVGKKEYRSLMGVLKRAGPGAFSDLIRTSGWEFTPDQWQVQKWDQFFRKVGSFERLVYCTTNVEPAELEKLPGRSGLVPDGGDTQDIGAIVQCALDRALRERPRSGGPLSVSLPHAPTCPVTNAYEPSVAFLKDGPYAIPVLSGRTIHGPREGRSPM